ncbi:MAG: bifunctional hydroxymethylpyrimidine kinase/phosphomethylpyrimidine kinase [Thermodesulfobacteriota bacterium]
MKTVLTIAGSDPSGGAGIQADLTTFSAFNVKGLSAVTAVTAQEPGAVKGVFPVPPSFVVQQIETLARAYTIDAVKLGMLAKRETVTALSELLRRLNLTNVVLDPLLVSTSGFPLLEEEGIPALKELLPRVLIVTPNLHEASVLTGMEVASEGDMREAAKRFREMGTRYALIKGGHLTGKAVDILHEGEGVKRYVSERIGKELHGTGCVLSAAIAACLAEGIGVTRAVERAKVYITNLIKRRGI